MSKVNFFILHILTGIKKCRVESKVCKYLFLQHLIFFCAFKIHRHLLLFNMFHFYHRAVGQQKSHSQKIGSQNLVL